MPFSMATVYSRAWMCWKTSELAHPKPRQSSGGTLDFHETVLELSEMLDNRERTLERMRSQKSDFLRNLADPPVARRISAAE